MTMPTPPQPTRTHIYGVGTLGSIPMLTGLKRSAVAALVTFPWYEDPSAETPVEKHGVYACAGGMWARVASFDTRAEADQYVVDDPEDLIQEPSPTE